MAQRSFAINTTPHEASIGEHVLKFQAEAVGAEFAQAYAGLRDAQKAVRASGEEGVDPSDLVAVNAAMRAFLATFLLPESAALFGSLKLPDRILVGLIEWLGELYGGGSGNDKPTSSSASS